MTMISRKRTRSLVIISMYVGARALHSSFQVGSKGICLAFWFTLVVYSAGGYSVGASSSCRRLLIWFWYVQPHFLPIHSVYSLQFTMGVSKVKDVLYVFPLCYLHDAEVVNPCFRSPAFNSCTRMWFWKDI